MRYVALLRAVNVGGTGKMPMADLREICAEAGFHGVQTYIASGNVVLESALGADAVQAALAARLRVYAGKEVGVLVRSAEEVADVVARNPFAQHPGNRVGVLFCEEVAEIGPLVGHRAEEMLAVGREIYVYFPDGMGVSKLKLAAMEAGTMRNMNTVVKLAQMSAE